MKLGAKPAIGILIVLLLSSFAWAAPAWEQRPTGYVNDFAHVLDANTVAQIENIAQQVDAKGKAQIAVVTVPSLDGSDIESYAVKLYKTWGIGYKGTDHGVLILLAVQDRRYRTEVGYGLEPIFPDGKVGGFWREAIPNLKAADYSGAILLVTTRIADVIAKDAGFEISTDRTNLAPVVTHEPERLSTRTIIFWIVVAMIVLATPFGRALLWGLLLSGSMGRRGGYGGGSDWGGSSGGGFGGGGGGFGGFGGGSSGGGGASGSW